MQHPEYENEYIQLPALDRGERLRRHRRMQAVNGRGWMMVDGT
jgi:hypothetical protein